MQGRKDKSLSALSRKAASAALESLSHLVLCRPEPDLALDGRGLVRVGLLGPRELDAPLVDDLGQAREEDLLDALIELSDPVV